MDAYQQQQQHLGYMRPPPPPQQQQQQVPPPPADPYHYYHQYQQRPPLPQQPQGGTSWYPNPFQYNPPPPSHSVSPPLPQQWPPLPAPPPPPSSSYPYPTHLPPQSHHFPPPRPHVPPPTQPHSQEWGNPNWEQQQHQAWEYPSAGRNHVEDWAAKARAWAATKNGASEDQHPQSPFTTVGRSEEQSWYYDQNPQTVDTHYQGVQQQPFPATTYQQFPVSAAPHQLPVAYPQENASFNMGQPSHVSDRPQPYLGGAATSNASPSVHQQEVPSSYSSVTGKEETGDQKEQLYRSLPLPISSAQEGQHHLPPSLPAIGRSVLTEQPFAYSNQAANPTADLSNQPLEFAPGFSCDHDPHAQLSYAAHHDAVGTVKGIGSAAPMPSISSWTPAVTTGVVYPPALPPGPQDPTIVPSSVSGHAAPPFGNFPGTSFQPPISPAGVPYGLGAGNALHPTGGFADAYGVSNISERPKKASVPNWLKEEIIKKASVMTRSSLEHPREEIESMDEEGVDKSFEKGNQAGSKSIGSPRSTEEEDDDEDYVEAARTAAINQEIKRILTEVLLKVTDELFDEIATKVLDEDDLIIEVEHQPVASNHKVPSPSHPAISTPKASAKVLVPVRTMESENEDVNEKSSSSSHGNVLGLVNYASDEDDEIESSSISNSRKNPVPQLLAIPESAEDMNDAAENGNSQVELGKNSGVTNIEIDLSKTSSVGSDNKINGAFSELSEHAHSKVVSGVRHVEISVNSEKILESNNKAVPKATVEENAKIESERIGESVNVEKPVVDYSQARDTRARPDQDSRHESRSSGSMADEKADDGHRRHDGKHSSKEKGDLNGSKEKKRERKDKTGESAKEPESRRRSSHPEVKEDRKDAEKLHRSSVKEDATRKRDRSKEKEEDRARHKPTSDSSKHKRTRSSSISSRGRNSKDNDSSDEASDDSKRKHSRKQRSSPSPVRSRRRQVSRSPHSKHSQRRHSPYSSLETTRRRRSRSQSPVRRHK